MKTNKSPALSWCIRKFQSKSSMLCLGPWSMLSRVSQTQSPVAGRGSRGSRKTPPSVDPAAAKLLCSSLPHTISVKPSSIFKHSLFRISFVCSFFIFLTWRRKEKQGQQLYPVFLQERNEPLQSRVDLLDKYIFRHLGTLNVYDLPEKQGASFRIHYAKIY